MDPQLFARYNKFAESYRTNSPNIYFFLKDCGLQRIYKSNGNRWPSQEMQNMCNSFQMEMQQAQWQRQKMTKDEYKRFLEDFFKKMNFNTVDLETCELLKLLTENLGIFGAFDDLTNKRIVYFNDKIKKLKASAPKSLEASYSSATQGPTSNSGLNSSSQNMQKNQAAPGGAPNTNSLGLPDAGKGDIKDPKKAASDAEYARINELMRQQKLASPVYITNMTPGQFYNPYTCPQYVPNGIDRNIPLPMNRNDPNYPKLKAIIDEEIILANQELDYHKIDMARNHLEKAAFYLKNIID